VLAARKRRGLIEEVSCPGNHAGPAHGVIAPGLRAIAHGIGAIQGIVEAAPAGIGSIECIARIHDRHNQLRARNGSDFVIDIGRIDLEVIAFGQQVADLLKEGRVGRCIMALARPGLVPGVDPGLQRIARRQQFAVARAQLVNQFGQSLPEGVGCNTGSGQSLGVDHLVQAAVDLQSVKADAVSHG